MVAVLGRGTRVRGAVSGEGDLRIEGQVEGPVSLRGDIVIETAATVDGDVEGRSIVVSGTVMGDIAAQRGVSIRAGAHVRGVLRGEQVSVEEGARVSGRIEAEFELPAELAESRR